MTLIYTGYSFENNCSMDTDPYDFEPSKKEDVSLNPLESVVIPESTRVLEGAVAPIFENEEMECFPTSVVEVASKTLYPPNLRFDMSVDSKDQMFMPNALDGDVVLEQLANFLDATAMKAITMAVKQAEETKEAQFIKGRLYNLPRSLLVTAAGDIYVLFNRKKQGDIRRGKGAYKNVYSAINLRSGKMVAFLSVKKDPRNMDCNYREYKLSEDLGNGVISGSFVERGEKTAWLGMGMDGDLEQGLRIGCIDLSNKNTRLDLAVQMLERVAAFHSQGYIHKDIKLENFLYKLDAMGNVSLILNDLGFTVKRTEGECRIGTAIYRSPESIYAILHNHNQLTPEIFSTFANEQHDSWALGLTMLTAFQAYLDPNFLQANPKVIELLTQAPGKVLGWLTTNWYLSPLSQDDWMKEPQNQQSLEYVIWKLLQVDPDKRWTPQQAADYLQLLQRGSPSIVSEEQESPMSITSSSSSDSI